MHICFLCSEYPKEGFPHGGFGTFVKTISLQLVNAGMKVSIVGVNYTGNYEEKIENGVSIYRVEKHKTKGLSWLLNSTELNKCIRKIHRSEPISIIESSELGLAFIRKLPSIRYIIRLHGGHHFFAEAEKRGINFWKGFQEKISFNKADAFIAVSDYVKKHTEKYLSYHSKTIDIINYPIDFTLFKPSQTPQIVPYRIVFAGTVCEKKGVRELIQAFQLLKFEFVEAQLLLYGRDWLYPDGRSYIQQIQKDFTDEELHRVRFMGSVAHSELPTIYESAEICVFPSHMETQGLVVPEAMAMEKVVVFSEIGPGPETIIDGETGYLVDPYSAADIATAIGKCFAEPENSKVIGIAARKAAVIKFNPQVIFQKNVNFYKKVL